MVDAGYFHVDIGKGYNPWGYHRRLVSADTVYMFQEEAQVLALVATHEPITSWELFGLILKPLGAETFAVRGRRAALMALTVRLVREGKLYNVRRECELADLGFARRRIPKAALFVLGPAYVPPTFPDVEQLATLEDHCRDLRDVAGVGGIVKERGPVSAGRSRRLRF